MTVVSFSAMGKRKAFEGGGENEQPPRERDGPPAEKRIRFENSSIALFLSDPCAHGVRSLGSNVCPSQTFLT